MNTQTLQEKLEIRAAKRLENELDVALHAIRRFDEGAGLTLEDVTGEHYGGGRILVYNILQALKAHLTKCSIERYVKDEVESFLSNIEQTMEQLDQLRDSTHG